MTHCNCGMNEADPENHKSRCEVYKKAEQEKISSIGTDEIVKQYTEGESINGISKLYNIRYLIVQQILKENGVTFRTMSETLKTKTVKDRRKAGVFAKYGVENASQAESIKRKKAETTFKNYGVTNPSFCPEIVEIIRSKNIDNAPERLEKAKATNLKRFGTEHPSKNKEVQEKAKQTNIKNRGVEFPTQCPKVREKYKDTCREKYGVDHYFSTDKFKNDIIEKSQTKYGVDYPLQAEEVRAKIRKTNLEKYGYENPLIESPDMQNKRFSKIHKKLIDILDDIGEVDYIIEKRIDRFFVDIFLPEYNLCIEAFGDYWHANPDQYKPTDIIKTKRTAAETWERDKDRIDILEQLGFSVKIFWENEINNSPEKIKEKLLSVINENKINKKN